MRIGIFTFHRAYNCGAMLQAWALKTTLERLGHSVVFPLCNRVGETPRWGDWYRADAKGLRLIRSCISRALVNLLSIPVEGLAERRYKAFRRKYLPEKLFDRKSVQDDYDLLVFGSDQIWCRSHYIGLETDIFFLQNGFGRGVKKISYAASCDDRPLDEVESAMLTIAVPQLDAVSVREKYLADQLLKLTGIKCPVVLDPTLLLQNADYRALDCGCAPKENYLFVYMLDDDPFVVKTAREVACRLGIKLIMTPVYRYSLYKAPAGMTYGISPDRLVTYIAHAKYVMSHSFHGTVFSVIFKKQFLDLRYTIDTHETRSGALLKQLGLENRMANPSHSIEDIIQRLTQPFDTAAMCRLDALRDGSIAWLKGAVERVKTERIP